MKKDLAYNAAYLTWFAVVVAAGYGWVANLVTVWNSDFTVITGELVIRIIGIFAALSVQLQVISNWET